MSSRHFNVRNVGQMQASPGASSVESKRCGGSSGAPMNSRAQQVSTVFDVDPSVKSGRMGGDDDEVQTKPHRVQHQAPRPVASREPLVDLSLGDIEASGAASSPQAPQLQSLQRPSLLRRQSSGINRPAPTPQFFRDVETTLEALRAALRARGAVGIRGLARNFKICDTDGSRKLDPEELAKCLRLCKISLSESELETLFAYVDADDSGLVDYDEFLRAVRGRLPPLRRKLVVSIFNAIDQRPRKSNTGVKDGVLTADDLRDFYTAKEHPEVKAGKKTEGQVLSEMLVVFEGKGGNHDGAVSLEEWIQYYEEISASIDNEDYFNTMVVSAWSMLFNSKVVGDGALPKPVEGRKIDAIEKRLIDAIRIRSTGNSETRALETTFKQFDIDKNGTIEFSEFRTAMERFGLATGGHEAVSGCTIDVIHALFDRYDPDGSGSLSYDEFIKGIFKLPDAPKSARAGGGDLTAATGTSLALPSERGEGGRPTTGSYARGRGGVMGGSMNSARSGMDTTRSAGARSAVAGNSFNQSSGIFR